MTTQPQPATINLSKIECIPPKNTIATINQFILNTTDFINRFAFFSEEKLLTLDENIDRLETQLISIREETRNYSCRILQQHQHSGFPDLRACPRPHQLQHSSASPL